MASSKTEAGERSDRLELLSRPGGQDHHQQEDFQGGENSLLLAVGISKYIFTGVLFGDCGCIPDICHFFYTGKIFGE